MSTLMDLPDRIWKLQLQIRNQSSWKPPNTKFQRNNIKILGQPYWNRHKDFAKRIAQL